MLGFALDDIVTTEHYTRLKGGYYKVIDRDDFLYYIRVKVLFIPQKEHNHLVGEMFWLYEGNFLKVENMVE